ncbi:MAG: alpha-glucosidase [Spirochaetia bacterium]|nr:alpha-glucosidase [Spirochaetia bacterium]
MGAVSCQPSVSGSLAAGPGVLGRSESSGAYSVALKQEEGRPALVISHQSKGVLWRSIPGRSFAAAALGKESIKESRGSVKITDKILTICANQTVDSLERRANQVVISGQLRCTDKSAAAYSMTFEADGDRQLKFDLSVTDPSRNRVYLTLESSRDEAFFGFGEQYTYFDLKGRLVPILVQEQGIGRGAEPITTGANLTAGAGGDWHTTYAAVPHFITSRARSLFLENYEYSEFDLRRENAVTIGVFSNDLRGRIITAENPLGAVEEYTRYSGRMRTLPDWIQEGAVIGMQGGTDAVRKAWERAKTAGVPIAAFWLQDWVGQRKTNFGKQLWWNWELDQERYPEWDKLVSDLKRDGIRVMVYINPFLVDMSRRPSVKRNLFKEAADNGFLVKDRAGAPYLIPNTDFSAGILDLTNPAARVWMKDIIKSSLIGRGADGWMADFGEALPFDSVLFSGESAAVLHNRYPEDWASLNREAAAESGRGSDIVFFSRSGYTRSPGKSTLFWLGDQLVSWDQYDGIKSSITGLLSGGLSGFSLNHSDIGGYTTITNPIRNYHRSKELELRWIELAAFTAVFRTHEGNRPDENHQFSSDQATLTHFAKFARVFKALAPYRKELGKQAAEKGWPLARHLFLQYPEDRNTWQLSYQEFLLGSDVLVAPVLDSGAASVNVYVPQGRWIHLWSGKEYGGSRGTFVNVEAPIGKPAVFLRAESKLAHDLPEELRHAGVF